MGNAILAMAVIWFLFYGRIPTAALAPLCAGLGAALALLGRHRHTQFLTIDILAQTSRLNRVNAALKFWTAIALMALCVASPSPVTGIFLAAVMLALVVCAGGLALHDYIAMLALPVSFLLLGGLALLFEISPERTGVFGVPVFDFWLCVTPAAQLRAALVIARALGAVSCLYLLSLTTPMSELIGVLRRARCPNELISLMYLVYRYIFILLNMYHTMRAAAQSRLGYIDYRASVRTTGNLYSNLLARSYRQAGRNFDAMESRCYDVEIRFLETQRPVSGAQAAAAACLAAIAMCMNLLLR